MCVHQGPRVVMGHSIRLWAQTTCFSVRAFYLRLAACLRLHFIVHSFKPSVKRYLAAYIKISYASIERSHSTCIRYETITYPLPLVIDLERALNAIHAHVPWEMRAYQITTCLRRAWNGRGFKVANLLVSILKFCSNVLLIVFFRLAFPSLDRHKQPRSATNVQQYV